MTIRQIIEALERRAPLALQEDYDNCGLQVGDASAQCSGVMIALDPTEAVVAEAAAAGCNLIVTHHPLLFKGLKRLTGATAPERTVLAAIRAGIAVYSLHTAVDNAPGGVSWEMARRMGLTDTATLAPRREMLKLVVYVPRDHAEQLSEALFREGVGALGAYDRVSFASEGTGTFRPLEGAHPFVGSAGVVHYEPEMRLEMLVPRWLCSRAERTLLRVHPYEQPAYEFVAIENRTPGYGSGVVGMLDEPMGALELVEKVKRAFGSPTVRCSRLPQGQLQRVAMCGGSGSFLIRDAIAERAHAFITSDTSYHNFVDLADDIFIIDIGHFESEECCKDIFYRIISENFPNFAVRYSTTEKNPILYI